MSNVAKINEFLDEVKTFMFLTTDGDQTKGRPFGFPRTGGTVEALSRYYFKNGESFEGISVAPEYQERFEKMMSPAIEYYDE